MRSAFLEALTELFRKQKNIFLLTGDLGFSIFENLKDEFPGRFLNVGVAEQNMIGVSAGLALSGKIVFVYSIIPFATMRCFEQIRNDLCMHNLDVKIIGMGAGLHYGPAGPTHHAIEDIGIMRSLPNMTVISPSCAWETGQAIKSAVEHKGPVYIRLSKSYDSKENYKERVFRIGKGVLINNGSDITIISSGSILHNAKSIVEVLKKYNIYARLINIHTIKPIDKDIILKAARETKAIFTMEEHSIVAGLGSAVAEILAESNYKVMFKRLALPDKFVKNVGSRECLCKMNDLSVEQMVAAILNKSNKQKI